MVVGSIFLCVIVCIGINFVCLKIVSFWVVVVLKIVGLIFLHTKVCMGVNFFLCMGLFVCVGVCFDNSICYADMQVCSSAYFGVFSIIYLSLWVMMLCVVIVLRSVWVYFIMCICRYFFVSFLFSPFHLFILFSVIFLFGVDFSAGYFFFVQDLFPYFFLFFVDLFILINIAKKINE